MDSKFASLALLSLSGIGLAVLYQTLIQARIQSFDCIIVGGGTAGLVLAERLSKNSQLSITVAEAGQFSEQDKTLIPALYTEFIGDPDLDWGFSTVPQTHVSNKVIGLPRGKTLGGTSAVNGMYFVRASREEYDAWEEVGNVGWNWNMIKAHMKAVEAFTPGSEEDATTFSAADALEDHGVEGPIHVTYSKFDHRDSLVPAYFKTLNAIGIPTNYRASCGNTSGIWHAPCTIDPKNRTRSYSVNGFLTPAKGRKNLVVHTGAEVTKIGLRNGHAIEVHYDSGRRRQRLALKPNGVVVLTAGTYQSPKILELSGVGNSSILRQRGIDPKIDLPGVGENLQDHATILTSFELRDSAGVSFDALHLNSTFAAQEWQAYVTNKSGIYASVPGTTVAMIPYQLYINSTRYATLKASLDRHLARYQDTPEAKQFALQRSFLEDVSIPQIELVMLPALHDPLQKAQAGRSYMTIAATLMHPFSRGSVHIGSSNPLAYPLIDPNFLGVTEFESGVLFDALIFISEEISKTEPLSNMIVRQISPPPGASDAQLMSFVRNGVMSSWHPCGSTSMFPENQRGVVDSNLKVYGTDNIYIADASIIPLQLGTHTAATVYANAMRASELIELELLRQ